MLEVVRTIARFESSEFSVPQVILATGLPGSVVHPLVGRLRSAAFVKRIGNVTGEKTALYQRQGLEILDALVARSEQLDLVSR